jgi:adenylate cyclase
MALAPFPKPEADSRARRPQQDSGLRPALLTRAFASFGQRRPFLGLFLLIVLSNLVGSAFNIAYNQSLIVSYYLDVNQERAFRFLLIRYNIVAYAACLGITLYLLGKLVHCLRALRGGDPRPPSLPACQRLLVNFPALTVVLSFLGWLPGAVVFPTGIFWRGGWHDAAAIWWQFFVSFTLSAFLTTSQTFFLSEAWLLKFVYPVFFKHERPAQLPGVVRISFALHLLMYWCAVAVVPVLALLVVALQFRAEQSDRADDLRRLAVGVVVVGLFSSALIARVVGRNLLSWLHAHAAATEQIALGNFDHRIEEKRSGEFGKLTDRFNDMAADLGRARQLRDTFGQFLSPEVRDEVLCRYPGLQGEVEEITVLFADIRGFTRRSEAERPERTVELLNRFFSLAVAAVEEQGGWVNKFLGDGLMALFGAPRPQIRHADIAVLAGLEMLRQLDKLNQELAAERQAPLAIGIGINTGRALVGCIGATLHGPDGRPRVRREFTAIGATVNLGQRVEQLTKCFQASLLLTESTRRGLQRPFPLTCLGPQTVAGFKEPVVVYRAERVRAEEGRAVILSPGDPAEAAPSLPRYYPDDSVLETE